MPGIDGAWLAQRVVHGAPLRAVAVQLRDQRLAIYSPLPDLGGNAHAELAQLGRVAALVAPNHFHNRGLEEHVALHPGVTVFASATALARLARRCPTHPADASGIVASLPDDVRVLVPPATKNGELWLSLPARGGRAWVVGDGFFNIARTPRSAMGLLLRLLGICPGLRIGTSYRWMIRDRAAYLAWLERALDEDRPTTLIPCHGDVLQDDSLADRLRQLARSRL